MTIDELKKVLAKIQLGDNRQVDSMTLREWNDTIGHLDFADTIAAVTMHRRESAAYLVAAHLIANVKRIREDRAVSNQVEAGGFELRGDNKPHNFEAMCAAWNDQNRFAAEVAKYDQQLADESRVKV